MNNITLICTVHGDMSRGLTGNSRCNFDELLGIIARINPDVIFEELSQAQYEKYYRIYNYYRRFGVIADNVKLETKAVLEYRQNHDIKHIPVDNTTVPAKEFWDDLKYMYNYVECSVEYRQIHDTNSFNANLGGFKYLNSDNCGNSHVMLDKITEYIVQQSNDERMINILKAWNDVNEKREKEMLRNIYRYCEQHSFDQGLFFIGAGHRMSIIEKMIKYNEAETVKINWNYCDYEGIFPKIVNDH